jgi:hypothetical protein
MASILFFAIALLSLFLFLSDFPIPHSIMRVNEI